MIFKRPKSNSIDQPLQPIEPTYIGRDMVFEGNISTEGEIHVDGIVRGTIRAHTCLIDAYGELHGELHAQVIYVRGRVMGPIVGLHVHIQAGAHVEGNVNNETISIENGAYVLGNISHGHAPPPPSAATFTRPSPPITVESYAKADHAITPSRDDVVENVLPIKSTGPRN